MENKSKCKEQQYDAGKKQIRDWSLEFLLRHRTEYLQYLRENPPVFPKKTWIGENEVLVARFHDGRSAVETENKIKNYPLWEPTLSDIYLFLEIKPRKGGQTVCARINIMELLADYTFVEKKRKMQRIAVCDGINALDVIALNYYQLLGNPEDFLSHYQCVSTDDEGLITYRQIESDGVKTRCIASASLMGVPIVENNIRESFTYTYDVKEIDDAKQKTPGASTTITYWQMDKDGDILQKPWRIKILNYDLQAGRYALAKKRVREKSIDLTNEQFREVIGFAEGESDRYFRYCHQWNAFIDEDLDGEKNV